MKTVTMFAALMACLVVVSAFPSRETLLSLSKEELIELIIRNGDDVVERDNSGETYWWVYNNSDCNLDDLPEDTWCVGKTLDQCKASCIATTGCGGFNFPHGVFKKTDCSSKMSPSTVDLYLLEDKPQPPPPPPAVNFPPIWPIPASFTNGSSTALLDSNSFIFKATTASADLTAAFDRTRKLLFPHRQDGNTAGALTGVTVTVKDVSGTLQLETDESYTLDIPATGSITVNAATVFGAMHGLQTLTQLVSFNFDSKSYEIAAAPWSINDKPRFPHREVLVDSARHFEPIQTIMNLIDSLTYAKINVIHLHIVDSQSFPFDAPSVPKLAQAGAWSPQERFTPNDLEDLVEYGRARGVRIMPEIDTPGHAASWCKGHPEICPSPTCPEPLNPATNATFEVLDKLFFDVTGGKRGAGLFPDNMFHLGGDEVNTKCWSESPSIMAFLKAQNLTLDGGYAYFVKRAQAIAHKYGRDVVGWEEIWDHFGTALDKSTIIHQWLPGSTIAKAATAAGYRVLWSTDGVWYLDGLSSTWEKMYIQEPCDGIPDNLCDTLVLGGGGEMWGETVDTSDIQQTIWPRLAAIAERLWSPRNYTDPDQARQRFMAFRCLLNRRGIAAAPSNNAKARESPPGPGGCYTQ